MENALIAARKGGGEYSRARGSTACGRPPDTHVEIVDATGALVGDCYFSDVQSALEIARGLKEAFSTLGRLEVQEVSTRVVTERDVQMRHVLR